MEYESLLTICFECGKYGHVLSECPDKHKTTDQIGSFVKEHASANVEETVAVSSRTGSNTNNAMYGPWMIVFKKERPRHFKEIYMGRDSNRFQEGNNRDGSRFSILINVVGLEDYPNSSHGILERAPTVGGTFKPVPQPRLEVPARTGRHMFFQQMRLPCDSNWRANPVKPLKGTLLPVEPTLCWSSHGISSNSVEDHVPNFPYINQTRIHKDTSKAKKSSGGNKQRLNTSISKLNTSKTHVSNDPNDSHALTLPKDHTTSMPMQTSLPSHPTKQPHAKPSQNQNPKDVLTTLDPFKHSVISFATSTDERADISLTTRSNPFFISPADNGRVSGTNPLGDPPDTGEQDLGNMSDESDDSDYMAEN
ncbi:hypothetical protein WN944_014623 [Citrus x changshan-huyou]|uniref:CCHC-type domain-containing protein n=1 Tax=Citrus x changshan-huyou TaxID=2935761 RepID=A0AAP0QQ94_9ROSI